MLITPLPIITLLILYVSVSCPQGYCGVEPNILRNMMQSDYGGYLAGQWHTSTREISKYRTLTIPVKLHLRMWVQQSELRTQPFPNHPLTGGSQCIMLRGITCNPSARREPGPIYQHPDIDTDVRLLHNPIAHREPGPLSCHLVTDVTQCMTMHSMPINPYAQREPGPCVRYPDPNVCPGMTMHGLPLNLHAHREPGPLVRYPFTDGSPCMMMNVIMNLRAHREPGSLVHYPCTNGSLRMMTHVILNNPSAHREPGPFTAGWLCITMHGISNNPNTHRETGPMICILLCAPISTFQFLYLLWLEQPNPRRSEPCRPYDAKIPDTNADGPYRYPDDQPGADARLNDRGPRTTKLMDAQMSAPVHGCITMFLVVYYR